MKIFGRNYLGLIPVMLILIVASFFTGAAISDDDNDDFEIAKNLDIYYSMFKELNSYYVDETDPQKLIRYSIDEMLSSLDPYTVFIPESRIEVYKMMKTGEYGGIGTMIKMSDDGYVIISEPYEGYAA